MTETQSKSPNRKKGWIEPVDTGLRAGRPRGKTDPFKEIDDKKIVLRLLGSKFTQADYAKYCATNYFLSLKHFCIEYYDSCVLCDRGRDMNRERKQKALVVHHRNYHSLFDENITKDVTVVCHNCHRRNHKK